MKNIKNTKQHHHYCLLVNKQATNYSNQYVRKMISAIRKSGSKFTVLEPNSAQSLYDQAQSAAGIKRHRGVVSHQVKQRGNISALIACGGDGTFNLVARAAFKADLPVGVIPMGRFNNFAKSFYGTTDKDKIIKTIINGNLKNTNVGKISDQMFFSSIGLGFTPSLHTLLEKRNTPRFGIGWSLLGNKASKEKLGEKIIVKVDSFLFETNPKLLNVNLLSHSCGIPVDSVALPDDNMAEIIFDVDVDDKQFGKYLSQIVKGKYVYGSEFRLFRGKMISIEPVSGKKMYLDGEIVNVPSEMVEISILDKPLRVFA